MEELKGRSDALGIFGKAVGAVGPGNLVEKSVSLDGSELCVCGEVYDLGRYSGVYVYGSGKASAAMASAVCGILGERVLGGVIVSPESAGDIGPVKVVEGSHPVPDERSLEAASTLTCSMSGLREDDLYLYLLSGGSSALLESPVAPITLGELREATELLLKAGAPIGDVNTVRKHLSEVKGGRLAAINRATGIVLVLSDVVGDDLGVIGSAPLYFDGTTYGDALSVIGRYGIADRIPASVLEILEKGAAGLKGETPKKPSEKITHHIVGCNKTALEAAAAEAAGRGYHARIMSSTLQGEARDAARKMVSEGISLAEGHPDELPLCLIYGGETTVTVKGDGLGGRNQEMCLAALGELASCGREGFAFLSAGTDGMDGPTDAAGAVVDMSTLSKSLRLGLDISKYLNNNDAYNFFRQTGDLVKTGRTGTNVMDVSLLLFR